MLSSEQTDQKINVKCESLHKSAPWIIRQLFKSHSATQSLALWAHRWCKSGGLCSGDRVNLILDGTQCAVSWIWVTKPGHIWFKNWSSITYVPFVMQEGKICVCLSELYATTRGSWMLSWFCWLKTNVSNYLERTNRILNYWHRLIKKLFNRIRKTN